MSYQKVTEWLFNSGFVKTTGGVFLGSSASLMIAFQQIEHKIELSQLETNKKIEAIEDRAARNKESLISYVNSKNELTALQFTFILENIKDLKDEMKKKNK